MANDFHHYKGKNLSRSEKIERKVLQFLLKSKIPDSKRESSIVWEIKHSSGCCQIGRLLAEKRKLNIDLVDVICVLHDVSSILRGTYKNHAVESAKITERILRNSKEFTEKEIGLITDAVKHHSEKNMHSDNPYAEIIKDVDVLDCSLYKNAEGYYKLHKPKVYQAYVKRIKDVRRELGLQDKKIFRK
jgi:uncharacterized protein